MEVGVKFMKHFNGGLQAIKVWEPLSYSIEQSVLKLTKSRALGNQKPPARTLTIISYVGRTYTINP
jgi:hypothetical protein